MSDIEPLLTGGMVGLTVAFLAVLAYFMARDEWRRYTDRQVREAKKELREFVREREDR